MNQAALRMIQDAVLRVLAKSPQDVDFYRDQMNDPSRPAAYRQALQQAVEKWNKENAEKGKS